MPGPVNQAGIFAASDMAGAKLTPLVSPVVLVTSLAIRMIVVAVNLLLPRKPVLEPAADHRSQRCLLIAAFVIWRR